MTDTPPASADSPPPEIDTTVPHTARVWNYWLGGKDHYDVDRAVGDEVMKVMPDVPEAARQDRAFMNRAISHLAGEAGVRQFLDIGTGLPTANNTHEVAQAVAPSARVVYVDNDPLIMAHARALLTSSPEGATDYIHADLREPETILAEARRTLDLSRPVAISLLGVLNHILDNEQAYGIVGHLVAAVPAGSYLVISHPTAEVRGDEVEEAMRLWNEGGATPIRTRTPAEIRRFFDGFDLLEPGLVSLSLWRPRTTDIGEPEPVHGFGAVGRKI